MIQKCFPNGVFRITAFVKFKISNNFFYWKIIPAYGFKKIKISRKKSANQKSKDFRQIFVISNKKSIG